MSETLSGPLTEQGKKYLSNLFEYVRRYQRMRLPWFGEDRLDFDATDGKVYAALPFASNEEVRMLFDHGSDMRHPSVRLEGARFAVTITADGQVTLEKGYTPAS